MRAWRGSLQGRCGGRFWSRNFTVFDMVVEMPLGSKHSSGW